MLSIPQASSISHRSHRTFELHLEFDIKLIALPSARSATFRQHVLSLAAKISSGRSSCSTSAPFRSGTRRRDVRPSAPTQHLSLHTPLPTESTARSPQHHPLVLVLHLSHTYRLVAARLLEKVVCGRRRAQAGYSRLSTRRHACRVGLPTTSSRVPSHLQARLHPRRRYSRR